MPFDTVRRRVALTGRLHPVDGQHAPAAARQQHRQGRAGAASANDDNGAIGTQEIMLFQTARLQRARHEE